MAVRHVLLAIEYNPEMDVDPLTWDWGRLLGVPPENVQGVDGEAGGIDVLRNAVNIYLVKFRCYDRFGLRTRWAYTHALNESRAWLQAEGALRKVYPHADFANADFTPDNLSIELACPEDAEAYWQGVSDAGTGVLSQPSNDNGGQAYMDGARAVLGVAV